LLLDNLRLELLAVGLHNGGLFDLNRNSSTVACCLSLCLLDWLRSASSNLVRKITANIRDVKVSSTNRSEGWWLCLLHRWCWASTVG
jgi:hypothetical protein